MSFPVPPRAWSPVLSISTRREEMDSLRAQIDAANTQQKANIRQSHSLWQQPKVNRVSTVLEHAVQEEPETPLYRKPTIDSWSDAATLTTPVRHKTLGNTIKGELSSVKHIIKSTSKKQLRRLRTCAFRSGAGKDAQGDSDPGIMKDVCGIAELSSDPPMPQLEDTQRYSRATLPSQYTPPCEDVLHDARETSCGGFDTTELCNKSYSCDGCRQNLTGKDFYDFCPGCHSIEGILCMACASSGGCQRHRQETTTAIAPPTLCASPAPSYDHEFGLFQDRKENRQPVKLIAGLRPTTALTSADLDVVIEETSDICRSPRIKAPSSTSSVHRGVDDKRAVLAQLQHDFTSEVVELSRKQEKLSSLNVSVKDQKASLRDQRAALREQQISLREEALLLKEREYLARERDATFIRNLQAFALESLSRGQHIGAQFHASKCDEDVKPAMPMGRAPSNASHASEISLESVTRNAAPKQSLSELTATTEALIETINAEDKIIQAYSEKRKKGGQSAKTESSMTVTSGTPDPSNRPLSKLQSKEPRGSDTDDDDEEFAPVKKQKTTPPHDETSRRSFACPYCKFDPERYSTRNNIEMKYRSCGSHYLPTIPRIKQHLQRVHWRPNNHCQRCYKVFSSPADLIEHSRQQKSCLMEDCPFPEKMDTEQKRQIHVKRPNTPPETLWYDIYKILFPNSPLPDSPYADEYNLPTPASAAPSTVNSDETSHLLRNAFNEELNKYTDQFDEPDRNLLNQVLEDAMFTVLHSTPVTPSRSPRNKPSRTPSIMISPVTPSPMSQTHLTVPSSFSSGGAYPSRRAGGLAVKRGVLPDVPQLQQPERQSLAPALDKTVAASATQPSDAIRQQGSANRVYATSLLTVEARNAASPFQLPMDNMSVNNQQEFHVTGASVPTTALSASLMEAPSASFNLVSGTYHDEYSDGDHVRDAGFEWQSQPPLPQHVREDTGYDDECNSYDKDDDKYAMQNMVPLAYSNKFGNLGYSPIDSGYGSGNSMRPREYDPSISANVEGEMGSEPLECGIDSQQDFSALRSTQLDYSPCSGSIGQAM